MHPSQRWCDGRRAAVRRGAPFVVAVTRAGRFLDQVVEARLPVIRDDINSRLMPPSNRIGSYEMNLSTPLVPMCLL